MTYPSKENYFDIKKAVQKPSYTSLVVLKKLSDLYTVSYTLKKQMKSFILQLFQSIPNFQLTKIAEMSGSKQ